MGPATEAPQPLRVAEIASVALAIVMLSSTRVRADWTFAGFVGMAKTASNTLRLRAAADNTDARLHGVAYDAKSWQSPIYYGARLAYFFEQRPWLGVEAEFVHLKAVADTARIVRTDGTLNGSSVAGSAKVGDLISHFELSHGLNLALANAIFQINAGGARTARLGGSRVAVAARLGVGPTFPHVEATFLNQQENAYQWGSPAWQVAAGADIRLWPRLHAVTEFKWTRTNQRLELPAAQVDGVFASRHLIVGLAWESGPR